jgi:hypothetical protein
MTACMPSTYAFEPTPQWISVNPKPLLPFRTRGEDLEKPPLPSSPRNELFNDNYTVSTHLVPAACPRLTPDIPLPVIPEFSTNASERKRNAQQVATEILERQELFIQGKLGGERSEKLLWNCVNRYIKRAEVGPDGKKGLTLFLAHANGFSKEVLIYLTLKSSLEIRTQCHIDMGNNSAIFVIFICSFTDRRSVVLGGCSAWRCCITQRDKSQWNL